MDIKIKDGDIVLDSTGEAVEIQGDEAVLQQVIMCITAEKGGFIYNKDMGVPPVTDVSGERECKRLEALLREAVSSVEGARLYLDEVEQLVDGRSLASITVTYKDSIMPVEVII
ncbi:MAG: hypothetical protein IJ298_06305 [Ruminococcus sp.]|nr:hypothetical protein [Ruminococcus sp.]